MIRVLQFVLIAISGIALLAAIGLAGLESTWKTPDRTSPEDYFRYGSTGTELMPLVVFQVLPDIFPEQFQPLGTSAGDWVDQYGFIRGAPGVNEGLPYGVNVSRYRPKSGAPSPIPFVGFNCSVCHSARLQTSYSDPGIVVLGCANASLDLVGFGNAIQTSILDPRLTLDAIDQAYQKRFHTDLGLVEKLTISDWLEGARAQLNAGLPLRDLPFSGKDIRNPNLIPSGPGRNEPMTETVRFLIDRTPTWPGGGASKIPCIYHESWREWAQFDGSVRDPILRNSLAALGVGASINSLAVPGILNTLRQSAAYDDSLNGPKFTDLVKTPNAIDAIKAARGKTVYDRYCLSCHGSPAPNGQWTKGPRQGIVIPYQEVGTDPSRVTFRYYSQMAKLIEDFFPEGHPLKPDPKDIRPNAGDPVGYISSPLESLFSRAPYLHNGSVPTLAELINLKPRPAVFYRGTNLFDPSDVGLVAPDKGDNKTWFRYDTSLQGNLNTGHNYPWTYKGPGWDEQSLRDLLEYLKTF